MKAIRNKIERIPPHVIEESSKIFLKCYIHIMAAVGNRLGNYKRFFTLLSNSYKVKNNNNNIFFETDNVEHGLYNKIKYVNEDKL